ncbi:unnamed protein product [Urochloa humidicola]
MHFDKRQTVLVGSLSSEDAWAHIILVNNPLCKKGMSCYNCFHWPNKLWIRNIDMGQNDCGTTQVDGIQNRDTMQAESKDICSEFMVTPEEAIQSAYHEDYYPY